MRRSLPLLLLVLLALPVLHTIGQDAPARDDATFRVAAYNLLNLFDVFDDPYTEDERTAVKPRKEVKQVVEAIRSLDADLVAVSEIENEGVLKAVNTEFLHDMGYRYVAALDSNDGRGITTGVLSRKPIVSVTSYRWQELRLPGEERVWSFARDLMHVRVQVTPQRIAHVFVVHFKSKHTTHKDDPQSAKWRLAEATAARRIINEILQADPNAWVMITGDFNDTPETPTISTLTATTDGRPGLIDTHSHLDADKRITFLRPPYRSTIDYILVSPSLADRVVKAQSYVLADESLLEGSDHAPVVTTFKLD